MIVLVLLALLAIVGGLIITTAVGVARIERAHPPTGRMISVNGGRLHMVELAPRGPAIGPPVLLLHGASGNLEDMRLALGEKLAANRRIILVDRPGHGWSERLGGDADASPANQAALVAQVLNRLGITQSIVVGHSWSGALAAAYALSYPERTAGLVLISPVTHPWRGGVAWYYNLATTRVVGSLFARTLVLPLGLALIDRASKAVFAPHQAPDNYVRRAAISLVLRPKQFLANARDVAGLKDFVAAQAPRYRDLQTPTVVVTGDRDTTVAPKIHSRAVAAALPNARLIVLEGVGHMPHHTAADIVVSAIDRLATAATLSVEAAQ
jgi:pimeloyl-ACP methyl ester carboxylesterase